MNDQDSRQTPSKSKLFPWVLIAIVIGASTAWLTISDDNDPTQAVDLSKILKTGDAENFNVLLITLDTTKPTRLGCYGYELAATPAIDAIANTGVRFDDAVTSTPLTLPSHATILTGCYPPTIGVRDNGTYRLGDEHTTLTEILKGNGYDTAAFISAFVLDKRFGLRQGFDTYEFEAETIPDNLQGPTTLEHERRADNTTSSAITWLRQKQKRNSKKAPFFLWVHYFDPHAPYSSPLAEQEKFQGRPYDAEIAFMDLHIKRLLRTIDEMKLRENTIIVVQSDHGEGLYEHNEAMHGVFIYESTMKAALLISCPTLFNKPYRVSDRVVGTVDILPTILDLLNIQSLPNTDGFSLISNEVPTDRTIYIETKYPQTFGCSPLYGLRTHSAKYILAPEREYYDLRNDPFEKSNLYNDSPPGLDNLEAKLNSMTSKWDNKGKSTLGTRTLSAAEQEKLAALGYVGGGVLQNDERNLPDPKLQIEVINEITEATRLNVVGKKKEALALATEIARESEGWDAPILIMTGIYMDLGQPEEAARVIGEFTKKHPTPQALFQFGWVLNALGRAEECLKQLEAAEILDPNFGAIPMLRGDVYMNQGRYKEAMEQYQRAIRIDGERVGPMTFPKLQLAKEKLLHDRDN